MATRTIIIEANRQSATQPADDITPIQLAQEDTPNRWTNNIPEGINIEVGDTIQVEACTINAKGDSEAMIEFLGEEGINTEKSNTFLDNRVELEYAFYMNNNWVYNLALPKIQAQFYNGFNEAGTEMATPTTTGYGANSAYTFYGAPTLFDRLSYNSQSCEAYNKGAPYSNLEGFPGATKNPTTRPTQAKLYMMNNYAGWFNANQGLPGTLAADLITGSPNKSVKPPYTEFKGVLSNLTPKLDDFSNGELLTKTLRVKVEKGFNSTSSVGEQITSQLQQKDITTNNVKPGTFVQITDSEGTFQNNFNPSPGLSQPTYITIPAGPGLINYYIRCGMKTGGNEPQFEFLEEIGGGPDGAPTSTTYVSFLGNIFNNNIMCDNPNRLLWGANLCTARLGVISGMVGGNFTLKDSSTVNITSWISNDSSNTLLASSIANEAVPDVPFATLYCNKQFVVATTPGQVNLGLRVPLGAPTSTVYVWKEPIWYGDYTANMNMPSEPQDLSDLATQQFNEGCFAALDTNFNPRIDCGRFGLNMVSMNDTFAGPNMFFINSAGSSFNRTEAEGGKTYIKCGRYTILCTNIFYNEAGFQQLTNYSPSDLVSGPNEKGILIPQSPDTFGKWHSNEKFPPGQSPNTFVGSAALNVGDRATNPLVYNDDLAQHAYLELDVGRFDDGLTVNSASAGFDPVVKGLIPKAAFLAQGDQDPTTCRTYNQARTPDTIRVFSRWREVYDLYKSPDPDNPPILNDSMAEDFIHIQQFFNDTSNVSVNCDLSRKYNIAAIPCFQTDTSDALTFKAAVIGLLIYDEMDVPSVMAQHETGGINQPGAQATQAFMRGQYIGFDPSLNRLNYSLPINFQKRGDLYTNSGTDEGKYPTDTTDNAYLPYCYIGANNPVLSFDDTQSRFSIKNLHLDLMEGQNYAITRPQTGQGPPVPVSNTQASQVIISVNNALCNYMSSQNPASSVEGTTDGDRYLPSENLKFGEASEDGFCSAQCGIGLTGMSLFNKEQFEQGQLVVGNTFVKGVELYNYRPVPFTGSLFEKLGFDLQQFLPWVGNNDVVYNRGNQKLFNKLNVNLGIGQLRTLIPATTNAYYSATEMPFLVTQSRGFPINNNGGIPNGVVAKTNAVSDEIIANNLPQKLDYPYLVVYSSIAENSDFYGGKGGNSRLPAVAYITRNYAQGDFFYSFATTWSYTADRSFVITDITSDIRMPNGSPAPLDRQSSVIYKITKPLVSANPVEDTKTQNEGGK